MKIFLSVLIAAIVVVVTIVGGCCLMMAHPHVRVTPQPLSLNEYRTQFGYEEFPSTASNIWYAISSVAGLKSTGSMLPQSNAEPMPNASSQRPTVLQ